MAATQQVNQSEINGILWKACDTFRGAVDPSEYKNYILVMLFVKYINLGGRQMDDAVQQHFNMSLPDAAALRRHNGDRRAEKQDPEITASVSQAIRPVIERMTGDRHRAEEIFQEVFFTVWQKRKQYKFPKRFRSWLYTIAANRCRQDFRKSKLPTTSIDHSSELVSAGVGGSPDEAAISTENATIVAIAVTQLPTQQRTVVV